MVKISRGGDAPDEIVVTDRGASWIRAPASATATSGIERPYASSASDVKHPAYVPRGRPSMTTACASCAVLRRTTTNGKCPGNPTWHVA